MKTVGKLTIEPVGDLEIRSVRSFDAPRKLVWDCHTQPALLQRWMLGPEGWTMPVCELDFSVGGKFRYLWRNADGREFGQNGAFKEISAHDRIVHSEKFSSDPSPGEGAIITTTFEEADRRTTVTMSMRFPSPEVRKMALESGMETGMEAGYERLDQIFSEKVA